VAAALGLEHEERVYAGAEHPGGEDLRRLHRPLWIILGRRPDGALDGGSPALVQRYGRVGRGRLSRDREGRGQQPPLPVAARVAVQALEQAAQLRREREQVFVSQQLAAHPTVRLDQQAQRDRGRDRRIREAAEQVGASSARKPRTARATAGSRMR
jgi:hypothetical protein